MVKRKLARIKKFLIKMIYEKSDIWKGILTDFRDPRGKRWSLGAVVRAMALGLCIRLSTLREAPAHDSRAF
jgi:hypothetical protein